HAQPRLVGEELQDRHDRLDRLGRHRGILRQASNLDDNLTLLSAPVKWIALLALSVAVTSLWSWASLPAALLIGPMIAGIVLGVNGARLDIPRWSCLGAQGVIAAMIAGSMTPAIAHTLGHGAVLFVAAAATTLIGATALGWLMSRTGMMPGATAVYGMSPGAA